MWESNSISMYVAVKLSYEKLPLLNIVHSMHYDILNFGNTKKCTIVQSVYSFYYLASMCFGIVAIFRELTPKFH